MTKKSTINSILLFIIFYLSHIVAAAKTPAPKPDQIIQIFRHGARGPLVIYDQAWKKEQKGQLTEAGIRQEYILGRVLTNKYSHLIGEQTPINQTYILSDVTPRCIQSAFLQRSGLYNLSGKHLLTKNPEEKGTPPFRDPLVHQLSYVDSDLRSPVALSTSNASNNTRVVQQPLIKQPQIEVVSKGSAAIFKRAHGSQCPNGNLWEKQNSGDEKSKEAWLVFKDTIDNINRHFPKYKQLRTSFGIAVFGDAMLVNVYHNMSMTAFGMDDPEAVRNFTYAYSWFVFHNEYGQEQQKQVSAFPFVDEILNRLEAFKNGADNSKQAALYSAHDYNIYAILAAFGVISEECIMANFLSAVANETLPYPHCYFPFFASNLIFELYNQTSGAYVKLLYNNVPVPLCNSQEACEYDKFVEFARNAVGNHTHETYNEKCGSIGKLKLEKEQAKKSFLGVDDQEEKKVEVEEKSQEKVIVESLIAGAGGRELLVNSTLVSFNLNDIKTNHKNGKYSNFVIIFGWAVLSIIVCLLIKSRTKTVRLHKFLRRQGKKRIGNLNSQDIEVKIH